MSAATAEPQTRNMEIQMTTSIGGNRWSAKSGDRITLPRKDAQRLVDSGQAVRIDPSTNKPMPLEVVDSGPEVYEMPVSPRSKGKGGANRSKAVAGDGEYRGELVTDDSEQASRLAASGRGRPLGSAPKPGAKAQPQNLDDVEDDEDDGSEEATQLLEEALAEGEERGRAQAAKEAEAAIKQAQDESKAKDAELEALRAKLAEAESKSGDIETTEGGKGKNAPETTEADKPGSKGNQGKPKGK